MIELGTGDWQDLNGDSDPNQFLPQYPVTSPRVPITHLQAWLIGESRDPLKKNSEIPTLLKDCK
ncbi:hypothetical protein [Nostoc sp. GT001]|uniref:hypothetical protein n=1 Tax=Nostoc sp. GT001 TaxID=3056647 RepID=UPI0025AAE16F|nr:hypothetical protein [Nostoc sp. GT001]MDM9582178.1 hypothetical protein [Nostoc sp. GT001]